MIAWLTLTAVAGTPDRPDSLLNSPDAPVAVRLRADLGAVSQLSHRLQVDTDGTRVRIPRQLGQDVLYPFTRFQLDLDVGKQRRNTVSFLYQPLDFRSEIAPTDDLVVGDVTFAAGEALRFRYSFPFYRVSWMYDLWPEQDRELAFGLALQIRNAIIAYTALDGSQAVASRDVGPVPLLVGRLRGPLSEDWWYSAEITGFYAPISVLNGSDNDVVGAVADASFKVGLQTGGGPDLFVALRYIGGGSTGQSDNPDGFAGDGFVFNWLHTAALTLGAEVR
ncbi:MAG: hypothetical protein KTR31_28680 [Myxococcales bacterium]|nr:hypothetical protein [Myxococcales bacterium]